MRGVHTTCSARKLLRRPKDGSADGLWEKVENPRRRSLERDGVGVDCNGFFVRFVRERAGPRRRRHTQHPKCIMFEVTSTRGVRVTCVSQTATPRVLDIDTAQPVAQYRSCKAVERPPGGRAALA